MKFKPGCGCLVLVLGAMNVLFAASIIFGMATSGVSIGVSLLSLAVFAGNVAVCFRMGLTEMRAGGRKDGGAANEDEGGGREEFEDESQERMGEEDN